VGDKDGTFKSQEPFVKHRKSLGLEPELKTQEGGKHPPGQYFPRMALEMLKFQSRIFRLASEPKK
jgi:hypothetical protein